MADDDAIAQERGTRLKECRKAHGWTQEELAIETGWTHKVPAGGLSPSRIANFEQGTRRIGHEEAECFQKVFGIPAAYFMAMLDRQEADVIATLRGLRGRARRIKATG